MKKLLTLLLVGGGLVLPSILSAQGVDEVAPPLELGVDPAEVIGAPLGEPLAGELLEEATARVSGDVRCPVCQGLSIQDSPSPSAIAMVAEVRELLGRGYSEAQVIAYFEGTYGEFVRLEPTKRGFNLLVWIAPFVGLALGTLFLVLWLRKDVRQPEGNVDTDDDLAAYREQVRKETAS